MANEEIVTLPPTPPAIVSTIESGGQYSAPYSSLASTFNESATMGQLLTSFISQNANNSIVVGAPGGGTYTYTNANGGLTIYIDASWMHGSGAQDQLSSDQLTVVLAHELGHAEDQDGEYNALTSNSPASNAADDAMAEGVASFASYTVANELNAYNEENGGGLPTLYANNDQKMSTAITNAENAYLDTSSLPNSNSLETGIASNLINTSYSDLVQDGIVAAGNVMASANQSVDTNITYSQYWSDLYLISQVGSSNAGIPLNNGDINWSSVTAADFTVTTNSDGSWTATANNILDSSSNSYNFSVTGSPGSAVNPLSGQITETEPSPTSPSTTYVDGSGQTDSSDNTQIIFTPSSDGAVTGSGNSVYLDAGSEATVTNTNNTIDMQTGATLIDSSPTGDDTINAGTDDTIQITNSSGSVTINASDDAGVTLESDSSAVLVGDHDTLTSGLGAAATLQGDDILVDATGGTINDSNVDAGNTFDGDRTTINTGTNFSGAVEGTDNVVNLVSNSRSSLILGGTGESVTSTGNQVSLSGSGASAAVTGVNTISLGSTDQSLTLDTSGDLSFKPEVVGQLLG